MKKWGPTPTSIPFSGHSLKKLGGVEPSRPCSPGIAKVRTQHENRRVSITFPTRAGAIMELMLLTAFKTPGIKTLEL